MINFTHPFITYLLHIWNKNMNFIKCGLVNLDSMHIFQVFLPIIIFVWLWTVVKSSSFWSQGYGFSLFDASFKTGLYCIRTNQTQVDDANPGPIDRYKHTRAPWKARALIAFLFIKRSIDQYHMLIFLLLRFFKFNYFLSEASAKCIFDKYRVSQ